MTLKPWRRTGSIHSIPARIKRRIIFDFIDSLEDGGMSRDAGSFTAALRSQAELYLKSGQMRRHNV